MRPDLARARGLARKYMTDTCVVERPVSVPDGRGGRAETWSPLGTFACRVVGSGLAPSEAPIAGPGGPIAASTFMTFHLPYPPADVDGVPAPVRRTDRIVWRGQLWQIDDVADTTWAYDTALPATRIH